MSPVVVLLLSLLAARPAEPVLVLDEVLVTAERVEHRVRDVAASVSIVTAEEIERSGARTATDALARLPGVFVQRTGQFGRTDLDIRGVGDRGCRVAVLVDGRPEKMSLYGCAVTHTLPVNDIDRIEVVRGPLSVLYGTDALSGVVNIVTRRAEEPLELAGAVKYGSFNTIQGRASAGTRQGRFHARASFDKAISDGHLPNSQYNGNDATLRAGWRFSPALALDLTGKYFTGVKHEPKRATDPDSLVATGWNRYDRGGLDLTLSLTSGPDEGFGKLFRTFGDHEFDPGDGWKSQDHTDGLLAHLSHRLPFANLVQAGVDLKRYAGSWQAKLPPPLDTGSATRLEGAVFVQDEQAIGPVTVNAGARLHLDGQVGAVVAPKAGVVLSLPFDAGLRASVNRGFRTPPFNYTTFLPPRNSELEPEYSWNWEVGWRQSFLGWLGLDVAGFLLQGDNLIVTASNPNPPPPLRFVNAGSFSFRGLEAALEARPGIFRARAAGTLLDPGVHTRARPGLKLDFEAGVGRRGIEADLALAHVSRYFAADSSAQPIDDYLTVDARLGWRPLDWLGVSIALENTLDADYVTFADLPGSGAGLYRMPGRSFTVGLDVGLR